MVGTLWIIGKGALFSCAWAASAASENASGYEFVRVGCFNRHRGGHRVYFAGLPGGCTDDQTTGGSSYSGSALLALTPGSSPHRTRHPQDFGDHSCLGEVTGASARGVDGQLMACIHSRGISVLALVDFAVPTTDAPIQYLRGR